MNHFHYDSAHIIYIIYYRGRNVGGVYDDWVSHKDYTFQLFREHA